MYILICSSLCFNTFIYLTMQYASVQCFVTIVRQVTILLYCIVQL